jgi:hypothetical protein
MIEEIERAREEHKMTDRQTNRQPDRRMDRTTNVHMYKQKNRQRFTSLRVSGFFLLSSKSSSSDSKTGSRSGLAGLVGLVDPVWGLVNLVWGLVDPVSGLVSPCWGLVDPDSDLSSEMLDLNTFLKEEQIMQISCIRDSNWNKIIKTS